MNDRINPDQNLSITKRELLELLLQQEGVETTKLDVIPRRQIQRPAPLSFTQERLWFLERSAGYGLGRGSWIGKIGIRDNFFEAGAHSLIATQMISRLRNTFQVKIPLRRVFESPTVKELARAMTEDPATKVKIEKIAQITLKLSRLSEDEAEALLSDKIRSREETQSR